MLSAKLADNVRWGHQSILCSSEFKLKNYEKVHRLKIADKYYH